MYKGDITNVTQAKLLFVFEGLLGHPPEKLRHRRDPDRWSIDGRMIAHLWDLHWRTPYGLDVVTFEGKSFATAMEERFNRDHIPYGQFLYADDHENLRDVIQGMNANPYVYIHHAEEDLAGFYGPFDGFVHSPDTFDIRLGGR